MKFSRFLNLAVLITMLLTSVPVQAASQTSPALTDPPPEIQVEPELLVQLAAEGSTGYMISFREKTDLSPAYDLNWEARGEFVVKALQATANRAQKDVRAYLDAQGVAYQAFWIDNVIIVEESSQNTFNGLMSFSGIESLQAQRVLQLYEPEEMSPNAAGVMAVEDNLTHVGADQVWAQGITGEGIVVANIDTGVRYTHEALEPHYRGNLGGGSFSHDYNWLDADPNDGTSTEPTDDHSHGSHTMGTMLGDDGGTNQIGMAPGAQWIACDACDSSTGCPDTALLTCAQWVAAPYPAGDPSSADASMRPHVVNNSWGDCGTSLDGWYKDSIAAWHAAGIYPVFSNGNASNCSYSSPPGLNTVGNPARYGEVTGVGSTGNSNGQYATHSNWGPTDDPDTVNPTAGYEDLKPQVLAPGVSIRSAYQSGDSSYGTMSGTSMSAPHVAGLIALMWQAAPCLVGDYALTETIIEDTATPIPYDDGTGSGATVPNQATGWGEINALAAVEMAQSMCGDAVIDGTVTEQATGLPVSDALVTADGITTTLSTRTDALGAYELNVYDGDYTVTLEAYGYLPQTHTGINATAGTTTTLDMIAVPAPSYTVEGTIYDAATGWPLYASIDIEPEGYSSFTVWSDPATGYYSATVIGSYPHTMTVNAWVGGYDEAVIPVLTSSDVTVDVGLDADRAACTAPGYEAVVSPTPLLMEDFDAGIPADWSVINNGGTCVWSDTDPGGRGNLTGGSGVFAIIDTDTCGSGTTSDSDMQTAVFDTSAYSGIQIEYKNDYNDLGSTAEVMVFDGSDWVVVDDMSGNDSRGPETRVVSGPGGAADTQISWHYAGGWDWWWQVDDVSVYGVNCVAPTDGGLVVGNVYDANLGEPLPGAEVTADSGEIMTASDPGAFYTMFAPAGSATLTATMDGFTTDVVAVDIIANDTVAADFYLDAGYITVTPDGVEVTIEAGQNAKEWLDLENIGSTDAMFDISEIAGGFVPAALQTQVTIGDNTFTTNPVPSYGEPEVWVVNEIPEGVFVLTHSLDQSITELNSVSCNASGSHADNSYLRVFDLTAFGISGSFEVTEVEMGIETATAGSGGSQPVEVRLYTLAGSEPPTWANMTLIGSASVSISDQTLSYFTIPVSGIAPAGSMLVVEFFTPNGQASGHSLFVGSNDLGQTGLTYLAAADCGITEPTDTGSIGFPEMQLVMNVTGMTGGAVADVIPWLTETPISGTVASGVTESVMLTFDASISVANQPGVYYGELTVASDTPYPATTVPVTMNVTAPDDWGKVEGTVASLGYCDGEWNPLDGAEVIIESPSGASWVVETDEDGYYMQWLNAMYGPVTVTATFDEHDSLSVSDVPVVADGTTTQDLGLRWQVPCIATEPDTLEMTVAMGVSTTVPFTLTNIGAGSTPFALIEVNGGFDIALSVAGDFPLGSAPVSMGRAPGGKSEHPADAPLANVPMGEMVYAVDVYPNENLVSFDSDVPGTFSTIASVAGTTYFAGDFVGGDFSTLYVINYDDNQVRALDTATGAMTAIGTATPTGSETWSGATGTSDGTLYASSTDCSTSTLYTIDLTTGAATEIGAITNGACIIDIAINANGDMYGLDIITDNLIQIDPATGVGTVIGSVGFDANYAQGMDFEEVSGVLYLAAYNGTSSQGELRIADTTTGNSALVGAFAGGAEVDAMAFATSDGSGGAIPWLAEMPTSGTVLADGDYVVDVTFDASDVITQVTQPGDYFGTLKVNTDDPVMGSLAVPVTMTVTPPTSWGKLQGTVISLGYCDADPVLVVGVEVLVEASDGMTWTLMTDDMGEYAVWMDEARSPVTVTVSVPEHEQDEVNGVTVSADVTTTQDFDLRWLVPCVGVVPDAIETTLELGATATEALALANTGAVATDWDIAETSDWLSVDPVNGTMIADIGVAAVDVNFDAAALEQPGEFTTTLTVNSDDPVMPAQTVPVTMTVTPPATWGEFFGTVSSLGYCDVNPTPLAYPEFTAESWTRTETVTLTNEYLSEGFEGSFAPSGWSLYQSEVDDPGWQQSATAHTGSGSAWHYDNNIVAVSDSWLISPQVSVPASGAKLSYWERDIYGFDTWYDYHGVLVTTDADPAPGTATYVEIYSGDVAGSNTWYEKELDLSAYAGQDIYIAFLYTGDWADQWYIDDVRVYEEYLDTIPVTYEFVGDENGDYSYWLPDDTYTVTVVASEHEPMTNDVIIVGSAQTENDYAMRWLEPCVAVSPDSIEDTLAMGETSDHMLTIDNTGAGEANFSYLEYEEGYIMPVTALPSAPVGMRVASVGDFSLSGDPNAVAGAMSVPAPAVVRPEGVVGLTHSASQTIVDGNSIACGASGIVAENSFIRVFDLTSFGLVDYFDVQTVEVGIQTAVAGSGGMQPGAINLYTLNGDLEWANMTLIGTADFDIADSDALSIVSVPVTGMVPAGSELVVEFYIPDGESDQNSFWPGSNNLGQTAPTYLAAMSCGVAEPTDTAAIGFPDMHLVMNVTGFTPEPVELPWLIEDPLTGTVAGDSTDQVTVTLDSGQVALPGTYLATLKVVTDDPVEPAYDVAVAMTVTLPANFGSIEGTVYSSGYCDSDMTPLAGADVVIEGSDGITIAVTTDDVGMYEAWRDEVTSPYTVTAMAADHLDSVATGVGVVGEGTTVQDFSLRLLEPCVSVAPTELTAEVTLGMSETTTLDITNAGAGDLTWALVEGDEGFMPMAGEDILVVAEDSDAAGAMEAALANLGYTYLRVSSGDFTSMSVADLLTYQAVLYAGTVSSGSEDAQAVAYLDAGGRMLVADNDYAYYYCEGGSLGATLGPDYLQCEYVSDSGSDGVITGVDIMNGITADISSDPWPDDIALFGPDAVGIFDAPSGNLAGLRIERNDYKAVLLTWDYDHIGASGAGDAEEVEILDAALGYLTVVGVPWLSEDPEDGVTAMDSSTPVTVTFDAGVPEVTQPGEYYTTLTVESDDALYPEITLPVTMTVLPPDTWGNLEGTVTGLGYCDENPVPLEGAVVFIESTTGMTWTLETDANGLYDFWFDESYSPVTVTVSYEAGYEAQMFTDVTISSGATTVLDANLRWYHACVTTDEVIEISVAMGTTETFTLDLVNSGLLSTTFDLAEEDWGFVVAAPMSVGDAFGYTAADSDDASGPVYDFIDISAAGTPLALGDDDFAGPVALGFDFPFYGADATTPNLYTEVYVNSNGFLSFSAGSTDLSNEVLPDLLAPNNIIALMWDDLVGGTAYHYTFDTCPYAGGVCMVVQYEGFTHVDGADAGSWQVVLFETGNILVQFSDAGDYAGDSSTTGIENEYGTDGINYAANAAVLADELAVCFAYPGNSSDCLPVGVAWLDETPVSGEILGDDMTSVVLTFDATLPQTSQPGDYLAGLVLTSDDPMGPVVIPVTMTVEMPEGDGWLGGTVIGWNQCDVAAFELEDAIVFVESANGVDTWSTTTDISGTYGLWIDESHSPVTVTVTADGYVPTVEIISVSAATPADTLHELRLDVPCFATDPYAIELTVTQGHTATESMMLLNLGAGMLEISDVTVDAGWMVPGMTTGTVDPDGNMPMDVVFSAVGMSLGEHVGELVIMNNDPMSPMMTVPVTMTVILPTVEVDVFATPSDVTHPGDLITYTMVLTNTSNGPVDMELMNTIPMNTTYVDGSVTGGLDFIQPTTGDEYVGWSGALDSMASQTFTFVVAVDEDLTDGTIDDTVTVTTADSVFTDTETVTVVTETVTVEVDVFATPADVTHPGDLITYTIVLTNTSNGPVDMELMNTIPMSTTYVDGSVTGGLDFIQPTVGDEYVGWSGTLDSMASQTFTFVVLVDEDLTGGTIDDTVTVTTADSVFTDTESVLVEFFLFYFPWVLKN